MTTGFQKNATGLIISKDFEAQLVYAFDWVNWLESGDNLSSIEFSVQARANDPRPLAIVSEGIQGTKTYVELRDGQLGKWYTVTAKVVTANGLIDRRNFRVLIENRSA